MFKHQYGGSIKARSDVLKLYYYQKNRAFHESSFRYAYQILYYC